jgi:hypothetical protein
MVMKDASGRLIVVSRVDTTQQLMTVKIDFGGPSASFDGPLEWTIVKRQVQWADEVVVLVVKTAKGDIAIPSNVDRERGGVVSVKRFVGAGGMVQTVDMTLKEAAAAIMEASVRDARQ